MTVGSILPIAFATHSSAFMAFHRANTESDISIRTGQETIPLELVEVFFSVKIMCCFAYLNVRQSVWFWMCEFCKVVISDCDIVCVVGCRRRVFNCVALYEKLGLGGTSQSDRGIESPNAVAVQDCSGFGFDYRIINVN